MISRFLECSSSRLCPRRYDDDAIVVEINFEAGYMTARLRVRHLLRVQSSYDMKMSVDKRERESYRTLPEHA